MRPTPSSELTIIARCRACGSQTLAPLLSLGMTPLANALRPASATGETERNYPLEVVRCEPCSLVQLTVSVSPEMLFRDYVYLTSFSDEFLAHSRAIVDRVIAMRNWSGDRLAVELGSNDGYLLQYYLARGIPVLGIEPARNIARIARENGIETIEEFFGRDLGARLASRGRRADVLHANNVLAHVPDLNGVLAGIRAILKPDGIAILESPSLRDMIDKIEFDTIYHEHLCYFSLTALVAAFARQGLVIVDAEHLAIHGGSLRVFARRDNALPVLNEAGPIRVAAMLEEERAWGVKDADRYARFSGHVLQIKASLVEMIRRLRRNGRSIAAYGASAKGATLLNYCGLGPGDIDYVVDRSTVKQGHLTPGTGLVIHPPNKLLETMPDYVLLLVWNFADEVMAQQAEYRHRGGRFIVPIPDPKIV
jgi:SAM-dependent methyltransferase